MTTELRWLIYTALLAGSLWVPFIIGVNTSDFEGKDNLFLRPPDPAKMPAWVHRSLRAHQNMLEQFPPFAAVVLAGAVAGVSTRVTVVCAILFFWLRLAHAVGMIAGLARFPLRPAIYFTGWLLTLAYAWQVIAYARPS